MASISGFRNLWPKKAEEQWRLQGLMYFPNARTGQQMPVKSTLLDDLDRYPARLDIRAKATEITQPWLIMHGDKDTTVPVSHAEELKTAQPHAQLVVIKNADHTFNGAHPYAGKTLPDGLLQFCGKVIAFLKE